MDLAYGRSLPRRLRAAGLVQVGADAAFPVSDPACNLLETATINLIRDQLLDHGIATEDEIAQHLANVAAGVLDLAQPPMISCWGRRPLRLTGTGGRTRSAAASLHPGGIGGCPRSSPESLFHPAVASWFARRFPAGPTPPQSAAWPHIAAGSDVLVASPTGSGKTLTGFLVAIDAAYRAAEAGSCARGAPEVLYISPLRALAVDVHENLHVPLSEIREEAARLGCADPGCASPSARGTRRRPSGPP